LIPVGDLDQDIEDRFEYDRFILAIHSNPTYEPNRLKSFESDDVNDRRKSHGCISTLPQDFGVIYDNI
jgi:hypothetical protein